MKSKLVFIVAPLLIIAGGFFYFKSNNNNLETKTSSSKSKQVRWVSAVDAGEQELISNINEQIIAMRTKEDVATALKVLDQKALQYPDYKVIQLYHLTLSPLKLSLIHI